jgi:hypothetical protein
MRLQFYLLGGLVRVKARLGIFATISVASVFLLQGVPMARADVVTFLPVAVEQTFTVPANVTSVHVAAIGGKGGAGAGEGGLGGFGAMASADLAVTPGQILYVEVGGNGADGASGGAGGFNGGAAALSHSDHGGGGGGASDVRLAPRAAGTSLGLRLVTAAGGGGGGGTNPGPSQADNAGGSGGAMPAAGTKGTGATGGGAATATAGGAGGEGCDDGGNGTLGNGGVGPGGTSFCATGGGGGGGGGVYGGGGGGSSSAGAGGGAGWSGFGPGATNTSIGTDATGGPSISISFPPGPPAAVLTGPPAPSVVVGCVVPKLTGLKLKGVRKALGASKCKLGTVHRKKGRRPATKVVGQRPKRGSAFPAGSAVNVTLGPAARK